MKKICKLIVIVISVLLLLQLVIFLTARYGWRLSGFEMCESPDILCVETVHVTDETVHIVGNTASSATSYIGYTYQIRDGVLYVGIKQNLLFGFQNRYGGFSFVIEGDFSNLKHIALTNGEEEKCIWSAQNN